MTTDTDKRPEQMVDKADKVLNRDLQNLKTQSPERLRRLWNQLTQYQDTYEWDDEWREEYQMYLEGRDQRKDKRRFRAAMLYLDVASIDHRRTERLGNFPDDAVDFLREYDVLHRVFHNVDAEQINDDIRDRDGEIYDFVDDRVTDLVGQRGSLMNTRNHEIEGNFIDYFTDRIDEYEDKIEQAVSIYIDAHGLPNAVEEIVDAAEATADAARTRADVSEQIERKLDAFADELDRDLRERDRRLQAQLSGLEAEAAQNPDGMAALRDELEQLKLELRDTEADRRRTDDAFDERIDEIEALKEELRGEIQRLEDVRTTEGDDVTTLVEEELTQLRDQQAAIANELDRLRTERERQSTAGSEIEERIEELEAALTGDASEPSATEAVTAEVARLYELDYVSRFDRSIRDSHALTLSDGSTYEPDDGVWDDAGEQSSSRARVAELLEGTDESVESYPIGLRSRYEITDSRWLGTMQSTELVVETVVKPHFTAFTANGLDTVPAGVADLLEVVNEAIERVDSTDATHLIAVASPTGWSDKVTSLIAGGEFARSRFDTQLRLCLVDLQTGELVYDDSDTMVHENSHLFEHEIDAERERTVTELLRREYVNPAGTPSELTLQAVVAEHGVEPRAVQAAFRTLADKGVVQLDVHPDTGHYIYDF